MTHDIVCVTYGPDAPWVKYLLRSIKKHARGFRQTILFCPEHDRALFEELIKPFSFVRLVARPEAANYQHMNQVLLKCMVDTVSDADFFHHIDSDCVVTGPWTPEDSFTNGLPDLLFTLFSDLKPGDSPWRAITENSLRMPVIAETMRRFPFVYPRFLYGALRQHIENTHRMPFSEWVVKAPKMGGAWNGFSEFCALGAFAMNRYASSFHLYNTNTHVKPINIWQSWSHHVRTGNEWPAIEKKLQEITEGWE